MVPDTPLSNQAALPLEVPSSSSAVAGTRSSAAAMAAPKMKVNISDECPIFLRKTYHMIETCDPTVASWSDDGETFVVTDTSVFEQTVIPQFFKHSKFSSFVRQLNFYGFRKIKYSDTIRIDPKVEAETANFWRFRHEKFQRGRPELLAEIRRIQSTPASEKPTKAQQQQRRAQDAAASASSSASNLAVKSEVNDLKDRIAKMSKNIDDLTSLVHNMKVKEADVVLADEKEKEKEEEAQVQVQVGNKRKKLEEASSSTADLNVVMEEVTSSSLAEISFTPTNMFPSAPASREASMTSGTSAASGVDVDDDEFVDDLFDAFGEDGLLKCLAVDTSSNDSLEVPRPSTPQLSEDDTHDHLRSAGTTMTTSDGSSSDDNRPDPQMMDKLSDALALLPKDMQDMLVNRLILTIMSTDSMKSHLDAVSAAAAAASKASVVESDDAKKAPPRPQSQSQPQPQAATMAAPESGSGGSSSNPEISLPLAAATLGALLSQYAASMSKDDSKTTMLTAAAKSLPVVPVH